MVAVGVAGSLGSSGRPIPVDHDARGPASESHEVTFGSAVSEPLVGEGVAKLVCVQPFDASGFTAAANDLGQAASC